MPYGRTTSVILGGVPAVSRPVSAAPIRYPLLAPRMEAKWSDGAPMSAYQDTFRGCGSTSQGEFVGRRLEKKIHGEPWARRGGGRRRRFEIRLQ